MFMLTRLTLYKAFQVETALRNFNRVVNRKIGKNKAMLP